MSKKSFLSIQKGYSNIETPKPVSFFWTVSVFTESLSSPCLLVLTILIISDDMMKKMLTTATYPRHWHRHVSVFLIILITILAILRVDSIYSHLIDEKPRLSG